MPRAQKARRCPRCLSTEQENRRLHRENTRLQTKVARLEEKVTRLQTVLEETRRSGKRQAAPFSKGPPKPEPKPPGRRSGKEHGPATFRPPPERIDEILEAPLPDRCPKCHGEVEPQRVDPQYQAEIPPVEPHILQFNVSIGRCRKCGHRVQGRHPRQTSNALGAAASQVGPRALALAADLNKGLGLSFEKVSGLFLRAFGLSITRGALCLGMHRLARACAPTYEALIEHVRHAPVVAADETGWKVAARLQWLWVFVTETVTVYAIQPGRGFEEAAAILKEDFAGTLVRDGWAPYRKFEQADHQTCLAHLLYRCSTNLETAMRGTARVPRAVQRLLRKALDLRDRRDQEQISSHGLAVATGHLSAAMDRLLTWRPTDDENRKLLKHLRTEHECDALFTFLHQRGVPGTNWPAEQAVRPAVVTRKVCGGNRTCNGAWTQQILASVLRTSHQQKQDSHRLLAKLLCSPAPIVAEVLLLPAGSRSPPSLFQARPRA